MTDAMTIIPVIKRTGGSGAEGGISRSRRVRNDSTCNGFERTASNVRINADLVVQSSDSPVRSRIGTEG